MTRASIKLIQESSEPLFFYSHCDGYPSGMLPDILNIGAKYGNGSFETMSKTLGRIYEEISSITGDSDFIYVIDMDKREIRTYDARWGEKHAGLLRVDSLDTQELNEYETSALYR